MQTRLVVDNGFNYIFRMVQQIQKLIFIFVLLVCSSYVSAQVKSADHDVYVTDSDILYTSSDDPYARTYCRLDVYRPVRKNNCPVVIWFHGGGLTSGQKSFPWRLKEQGVVLVAANYRLLPHVPVDSAIADAAAAVAWTFRHVSEIGGDRHRIYVSGHSAGGYLTCMVGLDKKWLARYGIDADSITALVPFSGQMISHFSYREMLGYGPLQPVVDQYAPLFHVRKDAPPIVLITGDRDKELYGRYEENAYMKRMLELVGHRKVDLYELDGYDHGGMSDPAQPLLLDVIRRTK